MALRFIPRNPSDGVTAPKPQRKEITTLTAAQALTLLAAIRHTRVFVPTLIALATGMRRGEILALRWSRVDLDRGLVQVVESLETVKKAPLRFKSTKTNKSRAITLPSFAIVALKRWKQRQAEELSVLGVRQVGATLVCPRYDGQPLEPNSLTHEFTRLIGRMTDVPRVRFHDLRHTHATTLLEKGVHPKAVQERLGHSTITTTLDVYSHVTATMQIDAAARLDEAMGGGVGEDTMQDLKQISVANPVAIAENQ